MADAGRIVGKIRSSKNIFEPNDVTGAKTGIKYEIYPQKKKQNPPMPIFWAGGFAVVFRAKDPDGSKEDRALRFFTGKTPEHSSLIAAFLSMHPHDSLVNCKMHRNCMDLKGGERVDMVEMDFINGETLDEYVDRLIVSDPSSLRFLAEDFRGVVSELVELGFWHGDLSHSNIMIENGNVKLIDYDSVFIRTDNVNNPATGEAGHPNFQHPSRNNSRFTRLEDVYFSSLVIYVSLHALSERPDLWSKKSPEGQKYHSDNNLIFTKNTNDLQDDSTHLWKEILSIDFDEEVEKCVEVLRSAVSSASLGKGFLSDIGSVFDTNPPKPIHTTPVVPPLPPKPPEPIVERVVSERGTEWRNRPPITKVIDGGKVVSRGSGWRKRAPKKRITRGKPFSERLVGISSTGKMRETASECSYGTSKECSGRVETTEGEFARKHPGIAWEFPTEEDGAGVCLACANKWKESTIRKNMIVQNSDNYTEEIRKMILSSFGRKDTKVVSFDEINDIQRKFKTSKKLSWKEFYDSVGVQSKGKMSEKTIRLLEVLFPSLVEIREEDGGFVVQYYSDGAPQEKERKNAVKKVEIPKQKTKKKAASSKVGKSEIFQKIRQNQGESDMKSGWARRRASIELDVGQEFWADASNIALATGVKNEIRIEDLRSFIEFMKSIGFENLYFIADASLRYYFVDEDRDEYDKLVSGSRFVQAPSGIEADTLLLQYALEEKAIVVTNDGFKAHKDDYPEEHEWFSNHQVQFTYIKEKWKLSPQLIPIQKNEGDKS